MSNIKAAISLTTSTLFPLPVTINISNLEQVNGDADFQLVEIEEGKTSVLFGPTLEADPSDTVYFYAQAASTNLANLEIYVQNQNEVEILVGILRPSDFMWLPLAVYGVNVKVSAVNLDAQNTSKVNLFWGHRS